MSPKVKSVVNGFVNLSQTERQEFIKEINEFLQKPKPAQESYRGGVLDSIEKGAAINFGPAPGGCPCCGK